MAGDAVWVMFLPLAHCDVFSISNDKSFSHLLSMWLPPSFFHEHSREKAVSADTPATSSLGPPVTEPVQMRPHEEGDPAIPGAYISTGGIWRVAAMSQQRDRIHRWAFEMQHAVHLLQYSLQGFQRVGHKIDQSNNKHAISSFETGTESLLFCSLKSDIN